MSARVALGLALVCCVSVARADRPDDANTSEPFHFAAGDVVQTFDSAGGHFRIHYTLTASKHAVPATDSDTSGTPDRVESLAALYEQVQQFYLDRNFRPVIDDSDGIFDVYLVDFGKSADGAYRRETCDSDNRCAGFIVQENDFSGYGYPSRDYADRVLASHEYFHAVQAAYDNSETTVFVEGSAVWATEQFDASLADLEAFVDGYLDRPDRSLYLPQTGPVDPFSYGAAIFFQFLSERFDPTIVAELWLASEGATDWFTALPTVLAGRGSSFPAAFVEFATWNLHTSAYADPSVAYARGADYPLVKRDAATLPVDRPAERVFPASTLVLAFAPGARPRVAAELVFADGVDGAPLRLLIARRTGDTIAAPVAATGAGLDVDVDGADELLVLLVNTAPSGESLRPNLCIGDEVEVATCTAKYRPVQTMPTEPGGCAAAPTAPTTSTALVVLLAMVSLLDHRRRRARARTAAPSRSS